MASTPEHDLRLGYEEYVLFPNDGNRHEILVGDHYTNPAPSTYHQTVSKRLQYLLYTQIELAGLGLAFNAPIDVQLSPYDIVQPDLIALSKDSKAKITPTKILGAPELVVEILSPSSIENDLQLKRRIYERSGVAEYWIVDPCENRVTCFWLQDGKCAEQLSEELKSRSFPQIALPLSQVW